MDASWFLLLILWFCVSGRLSPVFFLEIFSFRGFIVVNLKGKNHQECVKTEVVCLQDFSIWKCPESVLSFWWLMFTSAWVFKPHNHCITKMSQKNSGLLGAFLIKMLGLVGGPQQCARCFCFLFFVLSSCEDLHSWSSVTSTKEFAQQLFRCRQTIQNHERHVFDDLLIYSTSSICVRWLKNHLLFAWIVAVKLHSQERDLITVFLPVW